MPVKKKSMSNKNSPSKPAKQPKVSKKKPPVSKKKPASKSKKKPSKKNKSSKKKPAKKPSKKPKKKPTPKKEPAKKPSKKPKKKPTPKKEPAKKPPVKPKKPKPTSEKPHSKRKPKRKPTTTFNDDDMSSEIIQDFKEIIKNINTACAFDEIRSILNEYDSTLYQFIHKNFNDIGPYLTYELLEIMRFYTQHHENTLLAQIDDVMDQNFPDITKSAKFSESITGEDRDILDRYTLGAQMFGNDEKFVRDNVVGMQKIFTRAPRTTRDLFVFRGIKRELGTDWNRETTLTNQSTSLSIVTSIGFAKGFSLSTTPTLFMIRVPIGTPILYVGRTSRVPGQFEIILPSGGKFAEITDQGQIKKFTADAQKAHFNELDDICSHYDFPKENIVYVEFQQ